jgi:hypothetical protein
VNFKRNRGKMFRQKNRGFMEQRIINPWKWQDQFAFAQACEVSGGERVLYCAGQASVDAEGRPAHVGDMRACKLGCGCKPVDSSWMSPE